MEFLKTVSTMWDVFRSINYVRIFNSTIIFRISSFDTSSIVILCIIVAFKLSIVTFVVFVEEASIVTIWAQLSVVKRSVIVSYTLDVFGSIDYRRIIRTIIINCVISFNALISVG